jgi:hypothetical protein
LNWLREGFNSILEVFEAYNAAISKSRAGIDLKYRGIKLEIGGVNS